MTKAVLIIDPERLKDVRVELNVQLTLAECAKLEVEISKLPDGISWDLQSIGRALGQLRKDAEESIRGLKFESQ